MRAREALYTNELCRKDTAALTARLGPTSSGPPAVKRRIAAYGPVNQASLLQRLTTIINNQTVVLIQSAEDIRALRLAVQQLNATIARRSHHRGTSSEEQSVVLQQDEMKGQGLKARVWLIMIYPW